MFLMLEIDGDEILFDLLNGVDFSFFIFFDRICIGIVWKFRKKVWELKEVLCDIKYKNNYVVIICC